VYGQFIGVICFAWKQTYLIKTFKCSTNMVGCQVESSENNIWSDWKWLLALFPAKVFVILTSKMLWVNGKFCFSEDKKTSCSFTYELR